MRLLRGYSCHGAVTRLLLSGAGAVSPARAALPCPDPISPLEASVATGEVSLPVDRRHGVTSAGRRPVILILSCGPARSDRQSRPSELARNDGEVVIAQHQRSLDQESVRSHVHSVHCQESSDSHTAVKVKVKSQSGTSHISQSPGIGTTLSHVSHNQPRPAWHDTQSDHGSRLRKSRLPAGSEWEL